MPIKKRTITSYIAAGCLVLDLPTISNTIEWPPVIADHWLQFRPRLPLRLKTRPDDSSSDDSDSDGCPPKRGFLDLDGIECHSFTRHPLEFVPSEIQRLLLSSNYLAPFQTLFEEQWIHLSFGLHPLQQNVGVVRVYILPDDVDNRRVPRTNPSLRKARQKLLAMLHFGWTAWMGVPNSPNPVERRQSPIPWGQRAVPTNSQASAEEQSLLEMFNTIPSPNPNPDAVDNLDVREAMESICSSTIPGLKTVLYAYQRRSAALMLQKESQKQQVVDPRLTKVIDQLGKPWYYDAVAGTCFMEPRYYDGPCGGILAEEMGSGKTLICLALILASSHIPSITPDIYRNHDQIVRPKVGSLADMAAACIARNSVPWKRIFTSSESDGFNFSGPIAAIERNLESYFIPQQSQRRVARANTPRLPPRRVHLSHTSLVIVPPNLVQQWRREIAKHTSGLKVLVTDKNITLPSTLELVEYDMLLFSSTRFERLPLEVGQNPLAGIHFKRCIIDEGHKMGNSTLAKQSNLHLVINMLQISAKWIVTGTPSKGLYGVDDAPSSSQASTETKTQRRKSRTDPSSHLEDDDLRRIGSIASYYLQMRPWANLASEVGDTPADWSDYVIQSKQSRVSNRRRASSVKITLEALIIRHPLSELGKLLPPVDEKFVYLDGSYQDILAQNLFSMMIIFNAVQSERKDQDYFFHPRQRKALFELVSNLKQASFFGGAFFTPAQIVKSVETAEHFLKEGKIKVSAEDEALLLSGIELGKLALRNNVKRNANLFREIPVYVQNFPWKAGKEWSLDDQEGDPVCTSSGIISALQKFVQPLVDAPVSLQLMYENGKFATRGRAERLKALEEEDAGTAPSTSTKTLAGNTELGKDNNGSKRRRSTILGKSQPVTPMTDPEPSLSTPVKPEDITVAPPLAETQLISTASAKLSYLIDQIIKYQDKEQIIVFYENDNVAYYLAGALEILQVQHLIYARGLSPERRSQYVATFNNTTKFRVLLMDITNSAFGLDMKSASRIYFINPVLNPQIEAQAIGRARRISQQKPVTVETLVLKDSVEEVIVSRRGEMTQAEQWKCRNILDDRIIREWIKGVRMLPLPGSVKKDMGRSTDEEGGGGLLSGPEQMAKLARPQFIFGRGFGRNNDEGDLVDVEMDGEQEASPPGVRKVDVRDALARAKGHDHGVGFGDKGKAKETCDGAGSLGKAEAEGQGKKQPGRKNSGGATPSTSSSPSPSKKRRASSGASHPSPPKKKKPRVRFATGESEGEGGMPPRAVVELGTPVPV